MKSIDALIDGLKQAREELEKAIKPGPTLDYSKINPVATAEDRAAKEAAAPTINYGNNRMAAPKWNGAADKTSAVRAKIDAESKESGLATMQRRSGITKNEGNVGDETFKDEGTPEHENKEKKIGQKVKQEAQELLDMHKAEKDVSIKYKGSDDEGHNYDVHHFGKHVGTASSINAKLGQGGISNSVPENLREKAMDMVHAHAKTVGKGLQVIKADLVKAHSNGQWFIGEPVGTENRKPTKGTNED